MSTLLDETTVSPSTSPSQRLRTSFAAVRIAFTWLGTRKTLTTEQKAQAAETFGAEGEFLSAGMSLPYPEPGVRLIKQDQIDVFTEQLTNLKEELDEAVWRLDEHYVELKSAARDRLGSLFNSADYPESLRGMFQVAWDFPSVEPPDYLRQLNPEVYRQECERVASRFDEAVQLAETAFVEELQSLVSHLTERLSGQADGKPKVFRDSAIENLTAFFDRFRKLNLRSNEQLDVLIGQCQQVVSGVEPQGLRDNNVLRQLVASELNQVQNVLDDLLVDRPRRNILRRPR